MQRKKLFIGQDLDWQGEIFLPRLEKEEENRDDPEQVEQLRARGEKWHDRNLAAMVKSDPHRAGICVPAGVGKVTDCGYDAGACLWISLPADREFSFQAELTVTRFLDERSVNCQEAFGLFLRDTLAVDPGTGLHYSNVAAAGGICGRRNLFVRTGITRRDIGHVDNLYLYRRVDDPASVCAGDPFSYRIAPDRPAVFRVSMKRIGNDLTFRLLDAEGKDLLEEAANGGTGERADGGRILHGEEGYTVSLPGSFFSRGDGTACLGFFAARGCSLTIPLDSCRLELFRKRRVRSGLRKEISGAVGNLLNKNADPFAPAPAGWEDLQQKQRTRALGGWEELQQKRRTRELGLAGKSGRTDKTGTSGKTDRGLHITPEDSRDQKPGQGTGVIVGGAVLYAAPDGKKEAAGTREDPLDLQSAIRRCAPGGEVRLRAGRYLLTREILIEKEFSGLPGMRKRLRGETPEKTAQEKTQPCEAARYGEASVAVSGSGIPARDLQSLNAGDGRRPVLDFGGGNGALRIQGDYWDVDGIDVTRGMGLKIEGSCNRIRGCRAYRNLETGILIRHPDGRSPRKEWPGYNLVEFCSSYENMDASGQNADGFACKVAAGEGNVFRGCLAWMNTDDGFDLFSKNRAIGAVLLERCGSFLNGFRMDDHLMDGPRKDDLRKDGLRMDDLRMDIFRIDGLRMDGEGAAEPESFTGALSATAGNGNGFKLGGSGMEVAHRAVGCMAAGNRGAGFTSNSNPFMSLLRCRAYNNGDCNSNSNNNTGSGDSSSGNGENSGNNGERSVNDRKQNIEYGAYWRPNGELHVEIVDCDSGSREEYDLARLLRMVGMG